MQVCGRLRTSERLSRFLAAVTRHHLILGFLVHERPLDRRAVYRYLTRTSPVEVEVTLLSCADRLATRGRNAERAIDAHLELARELMPAALEWRRAGPPRLPAPRRRAGARGGHRARPRAGPRPGGAAGGRLRRGDRGSRRCGRARPAPSPQCRLVIVDSAVYEGGQRTDEPRRGAAPGVVRLDRPARPDAGGVRLDPARVRPPPARGRGRHRGASAAEARGRSATCSSSS